MRLAAAMSALAAVLIVPAALAEEPQINCEDPQTTVEMSYCAEQAWQAADAELNAAYTAAMAFLKTEADEMETPEMQLPAERRPETQLRAAQRAWITFRDAHCAMIGARFYGGTGQGPASGFCLAEITQARTAQLEAITQEGM